MALSNYQNAVLGLGGALALVSLYRQNHLQNMWSFITQGNKGIDVVQDLKPVGVDLLFLVIIVFLAGLSDDAGKLSIALVAALWLMFLLSGSQKITQQQAGHAPHP